MAHLTRPTQYNIEDSNIALLGSDLEKHVRHHAGDKDAAWENAGTSPRLQIWRVEQFHIVEWPKDRHGIFYDGDSYIVLYTYKKSVEDSHLSYKLHFWLGQQTTQDEAGTAAYKTVELDDHLQGTPIQYREVQGYESSQFLSYFPRFVCLRGGVATGFHHVAEPPPLDTHRLYRIKLSRSPVGRSSLLVKEIPAEASSLIEGDVYVLDQGLTVMQLNAIKSAGQERYKAAEFVRSIANERKGEIEILVYDESGPGASRFLNDVGAEALIPDDAQDQPDCGQATLYQLSDKNGFATFTRVTVDQDSLASEDAFLLDDSEDAFHPAIYIWLGKNASLRERRLSVQYAQNYLHNKRQETGKGKVMIPIIKQEEGFEEADFITKLKGQT